MATVTRNYCGDRKAKVWFVRNEQGGRFGPVDFETLKAWACDGRVGPANEISANGTDWQPAAEQRGLEMDWVAEVSQGRFYGPIHKDAMRDLVKEGTITGQAELFCRRALDADAGADAEARTLRDGHARLQKELEQARRSGSDLEGQCLHARQQAAAREAELLALQDKMAAQAGQAGEALCREQARGGELERRLVQAGLEREETARRLEELRAEFQAQTAAWGAERRALECEGQALKAETARALAETASRTERIAQLEAAAAEALGAAVRQRESLEGQVRTLQTEVAVAQAELADQQQRTLGEAVRQREALERQARALQAELSGQRQAVQQVQSRCEVLSETLVADTREREEARLRLAEVSKELDEARQETERLRDALRRQKEQADAARVSVAVEVLEAEPLAAGPRPKARPKQRQDPVEAEILSPARPESAPRTPPPANPAGRGTPGISMADLEQQARRELERLGAHGQSFFNRKR